MSGKPKQKFIFPSFWDDSSFKDNLHICFFCCLCTIFHLKHGYRAVMRLVSPAILLCSFGGCNCFFEVGGVDCSFYVGFGPCKCSVFFCVQSN